MRSRLLILAVFLTSFTGHSFAQMVGTNIFLQGSYLEIGIINNGAFGTSFPTVTPPGYHPHPYTGALPTDGLAEVYDYGHDGWGAGMGTPPYMGDYTLPGFPTEGWSMQVNGLYNNAWQAGGFPGSGSLTGGSTGYTNVAGRATGYWSGTASSGGLAIRQETRVDTMASWVVVTTYFHNTTGATIPAVFYGRTCDPDNDESWSGGSFSTTNTIVHQNDADHRVQVSAVGSLGPITYMAMCTKDCRAKCYIVSPFGLTPTNNLADLYNQTGTASGYIYTGTYTNDVGYGLVWNLGDIAAGDSTVISYAYVFNGDNGIDSALPDPVLSINDSPIYVYPDTLDACMYPGIDSLPIDVLYGDDKDWTWGKWTWSPSTGLASTTGVHNMIRLNAIPGNITYTVTGTDSTVGMKDCANKTFIFTVHSCHFAYANEPCVGNAIQLGMLGDSIGATYYWYGPGGFSSYLHNPVIFPASLADTGVYHVVRTIGGVPDTDFTYVMVHPLPVVSASSSIAPCAPLTTPLMLNVNLDSVNETFTWSGPGGFTSTDQNPTISPFDSTMAGTYYVTGTTQWGCRFTNSVDVFPGTNPNFNFAIHHGCYFDTVLFNNTTFNANDYHWNFGDGDSAVGRDIIHVYHATASTIFNVTLTTSNAHCTNSFTTPVDTRHTIVSSFNPTPDTFCLGTTTTFVNSSAATVGPDPGAIVHYAWDFGNGVTDTAIQPDYTYDACGKFLASLTVTDSIGCSSTSTVAVWVLQLGIHSFTDTTLCISMPLPMANELTVCPAEFSVVPQFVWTQNLPNLSDSSIRNPTLSGLGLFIDTLSISFPGVPGPGGTMGCEIRDTVKVHSVLGAVLTSVTASTTISYGSIIHLNADNEVIYYWRPDDGSLDNPNINNPVASPSVTTTYTVYGLDVNGCLDSANVTVYVDTTSIGDMPSGFTPNKDGNNDIFRPVGAKYAKMVEFRVFNRWGEEIFYSNSREHGWDGTYHGIPQDIGTYFYAIVVATPGGENATYKGVVTLIR